MATASTVLVYASELAAAIGRNKYKQPWTVFENLWRRVNEQQYQECVDARGVVESVSVTRAQEQALDAITVATQQVDASTSTTRAETIATEAVAAVQKVVNAELEQMWQHQPHVAKRLKTCKTRDDVQTTLCADAAQVAAQVDAAETAAQQARDAATERAEAARMAAEDAACGDATGIEQADMAAKLAAEAQLQLAAAAAQVEAARALAAQVATQVDATVKLVEQRAELEKKAVSEVQCKFGTVREANSRVQVERSGQAREIKHENKFHVVWMDEVLPVSRRRWGVGGRLDGLDADGRIVEIKNRARHFFAKVPDYEYVQVQAYMQMMDAEQTLLVQQLDGQQRTCIIKRSNKEWNDKIVPALYTFVSLLDLFVDDESYVMRAEWVRSTDTGKHLLLERWLEADQADL